MVTPIDLELSAQVLIDQHSESALAEAKRRAQEQRDDGDRWGDASATVSRLNAAHHRPCDRLFSPAINTCL